MISCSCSASDVSHTGTVVTTSVRSAVRLSTRQTEPYLFNQIGPDDPALVATVPAVACYINNWLIMISMIAVVSRESTCTAEVRMHEKVEVLCPGDQSSSSYEIRVHTAAAARVDDVQHSSVKPKRDHAYQLLPSQQVAPMRAGINYPGNSSSDSVFADLSQGKGHALPSAKMSTSAGVCVDG